MVVVVVVVVAVAVVVAVVACACSVAFFSPRYLYPYCRHLLDFFVFFSFLSCSRVFFLCFFFVLCYFILWERARVVVA